MNIGVHISSQIRVFIFSRYMYHSEVAGSYGNSIFSLLRNLQLFSFLRNLHSGSTKLHSHQQCRKVPSSPQPSLAFIIGRLFDDGHFDQCEVVSHCSFDLHFFDIQPYRASFHVPACDVKKCFYFILLLTYCSSVFPGPLTGETLFSYFIFLPPLS